MRIGSPPVKHPCFYGIDTPKRRDLIAQQMNLEQMRDELRCDSLSYLDIETLHELGSTQHGTSDETSGFCDSCFSGKYQDQFAQKRLKEETTSRVGG